MVTEEYDEPLEDTEVPFEEPADPDSPSGDNGEGANGETQGTQPGSGESGSGGQTSQAEDVISTVGKLIKKKDSFAKSGGYGRGGKQFKVASDQPGGKIPTGIIFGCTDSTSSNYNPLATLDDGSCKEEKTKKVDSNVISAFSKFLKEPPSNLSFPKLGIFDKFIGVEKFNGATSGRTGIILNNSEEESETTGGSNSFKAGTEKITHSSFSSYDKNQSTNDQFTLVYDTLSTYIKASHMIATQKECGDCDEKFVDDFLEASAMITATALAGECVDYVSSINKVKSLSTSLMNRKCKNC